MKTKLNYSDKFSKKNNSRMDAHKRSHANPSEGHASRGRSTVKQQKSSSAGKMGLSVGQKVPMSMFDQKYQKPNAHGMPRVEDANKIKRATKKALGGEQKKFFGL